MKKANVSNLLWISILFILFYIMNFSLSQNSIEVPLKMDLNDALKIGIFSGVVILLFLPSVYYAAKEVFDLYIKHEKNNKTKQARSILILMTLITDLVTYFLQLEVYYYFVPIVVGFIFYFLFMYLLDMNYLKKSQKVTIKVDDELVIKFLDVLGGKENITQVTFEQSRLKVELKDIKLANLEGLKELGAQGAFVAGNKLQARIGANASELEQAIQSYLSNLL